MAKPRASQTRQAADLLVKSAAPAGDALAPLREAFASVATACTEALGALAPVPMELAFRDIVSCPMADAQAAWADTTLVGAFQADRDVRILVGADAAFVNAALEAAFGADGSEPARADRAPTRLGARLAGAIFQHVVDALRSSVLGGRLAAVELDGIETADKLPAPARGNELSVRANFGLTTLGRAGEMFVVLPQSAVQGLAPASATAAAGAGGATGERGWKERMEQEVQRTEVTLRAILDERELTLGDIAGLRIGQVLPLKATPRSSVKVLCNDQTMFWCELGQAEGVYTLRIRDIPDQKRELIDAITSR